MQVLQKITLLNTPIQFTMLQKCSKDTYAIVKVFNILKRLGLKFSLNKSVKSILGVENKYSNKTVNPIGT